MANLIRRLQARSRKEGVLPVALLALKTLHRRLRYHTYFLSYLLKQEIYIHTLKISNSIRRASRQGTLFIVPIIDTEGPSSTDIGSDWSKVDEMVEEVMSRQFRTKFKDSFGNLLVLSWFIVDWVNYRQNPRKRILGHHKIFDHFHDLWLSENRWKDGIYWHYHHSKSDGSWGIHKDWNDNRYYEDVLCRKIIDRNFFPSCYRAGNTMETNASSAWLEKWIPFDFSSRSPFIDDTAEDIFDWHNSPTDWSVYHPSHRDYQVRGDMKRWVFRSLDADNRKWFTQREVENAFLRAKGGKDTILSFFSHDYKDLSGDFRYALDLIKCVAKSYPEVEMRNASAKDAVSKIIKENKVPLKLKLTLKKDSLVIKSDKELFSEQPFLAFKDVRGSYFRGDVKKIGKNVWGCRFERKSIASIAVGAADKSGNTCVARIDL
ncbi:hypothetical protein JXA85_00615 [Candidatus Woesearchaeota archaeon]|nr:hypothetical protein [Candidatus Woesearchaeota archaeon]